MDQKEKERKAKKIQKRGARDQKKKGAIQKVQNYFESKRGRIQKAKRLSLT